MVDTKLIYERDGHKVYAREPGKLDRQLIGYDYDGSGQNLKQGLAKYHEEVLWQRILTAAKTNPALQAELDRVIVTWELIQNEQSSRT